MPDLDPEIRGGGVIHTLRQGGAVVSPPKFLDPWGLILV